MTSVIGGIYLTILGSLFAWGISENGAKYHKVQLVVAVTVSVMLGAMVLYKYRKELREEESAERARRISERKRRRAEERLSRLKRRRAERDAKRICVGCKAEAPTWFLAPVPGRSQGSWRCRFCANEAPRYPIVGESESDFDAYIDDLNKRINNQRVEGELRAKKAREDVRTKEAVERNGLRIEVGSSSQESGDELGAGEDLDEQNAKRRI